MAPIRYSLHYEDYSEHLMSRFGKLLQMQSLVDMTLMCSSHTLRVHKAVLAASSAYFQEVLQKQSGEPLIILKIRFSILKSLVEFMYCGKTQCLEENLDELVSAAQFLKIKGLSKVTKEGLGITNHGELPIFTPPVVINRPPQSLVDLQSQECSESISSGTQQAPAPSNSQLDALGRANSDMVLRLPFNIDGGNSSGVDYVENPRTARARRGRPSIRRPGVWEGATLGRAAEKALLRREQDSRKAIHQLKHLQNRHLQDYMDQVTLSQAVNSICGPETSAANNFMNMDSDLMYMDQNVTSNVLDPTISYTKDHTMGNDAIINSDYANTTVTSAANSETNNTEISSAMSQYVNALKSAGLPTDLPILFESGDGSYINVNEQVLLDMVQSSEIQYEVIEQPNIIEKVADPSEIKSIDDLSKSIERGEMLISNKNFGSGYNKDDDSQFSNHEDAINSLNSILPDNYPDTFADQQNYVVLDPRLQENNSAMDNEIANVFSCIDGDMQFFTKSMSDDVKKYYAEQPLNDNKVMDQLCPATSSFNVSLLTKNTNITENDDSQYRSINNDDLRRNEDCYDFGLQLSQSNEDDVTLDCLMANTKQSQQEQHALNDHDLNNTTKETNITTQDQEQLINDLMDINESMPGIVQENTDEPDKSADNNCNIKVQDFDDSFNNTQTHPENQTDNALAEAITQSGLQWESAHENMADKEDTIKESKFQNSVKFDLTQAVDPQVWNVVPPESNKEDDKENIDNSTNPNSVNIPFALGLLPLKQVETPDDEECLKRKNETEDFSSNIDAKCLKRKAKCKKV